MIELEAGHLATKADLAVLKADVEALAARFELRIVLWLIATQVAVVGIMMGGLKLFLR